MGGVGPPTVFEVDRIAALTDPVVRNLQITWCYHRLSTATAAHTGPGANWCTFATWASKQAGRSIRGEDLRLAVEHAASSSPTVLRAGTALLPLLRESTASASLEQVRSAIRSALDPAAVTARVGDAVARGNLKVFREIGREFARFLDDGPPGPGTDLAAFLPRLRNGPPPDGQELLREGFRLYHRIGTGSGGARPQELLLRANLLIGLHEQTRLQPEIQEALEAGVPDPGQVRARLEAALLPGGAGILSRIRRFVRRWTGRPPPLETAIAQLVEGARLAVRAAITRHLMTLELAGTHVRLGRDLDAPVPESLAVLSDPDLLSLLERVDPTPDSLVGTGASDWADLDQRMHFIADLFRCYHEHAPLLGPPFEPEQVEALRGGALPGGRL